MSASRSNLAALARIATTEVTSGRAMGAKLRAVLLLVEAGKRSPLSRTKMRAELHSMIATELLGGRQLEAAVRAVEALERLDAPRPRKPRRLDPASTAPAGFWPYNGAVDDRDGSWEKLDAGDSIELRRRWARNLERLTSRHDLPDPHQR